MVKMVENELWMLKMNGKECGLYVITRFRSEIGRAAGRRRVSMSGWQSLRGRLLNYKESVEAARLRGVVRIALSSPRWRSPEVETSSRERLREERAVVTGKG
jgi:hypothetical protein